MLTSTSNTFAPATSRHATVPTPTRPAGASAAPMVIRFQCGTCQEKLSVPGRFAGRKGACPNCGTVNRVPLHEVSPLNVDLPAPPAPAREALAPVQAPVAERVEQPVARAAEPEAAAPIPTINAGAPLAELPERWTRGPLKIESDEPTPARRWFKWFGRTVAETDDAHVTVRREWDVDQREMAMPVKVGLLVGGIAVLVGVVWGFFYLVLKLVIVVSA